MKKVFLAGMIICAASSVFAQQRISEGTATYSVEYQLPDNLKPYAAYFPKEAVVYFKGDSTLSVQKSAQGSTAVLTNMKANFMRMIVEAQAKKYVVLISPAEMEEMELNMPEYTYTAGTETQPIAGFNATKYSLKDKKDGKNTLDAWYTKDVIIPVNSLTNLMDASYGTPLNFTTAQAGMSVKSVVKEIKAVTVPAGIFVIPKDAETLTLAQYKAMRGGK